MGLIILKLFYLNNKINIFFFLGMEEKLGTINGTVYAAYDYTAQQPDELNFKCNEQLRILDKSDDDGEESEWWWSSNSQQQKGYVPRNLLSLHPRLIPMPKENYDDDD